MICSVPWVSRPASRGRAAKAKPSGALALCSKRRGGASSAALSAVGVVLQWLSNLLSYNLIFSQATPDYRGGGISAAAAIAPKPLAVAGSWSFCGKLVLFLFTAALLGTAD